MRREHHEEAIKAGQRPFGFDEACFAARISYIKRRPAGHEHEREAKIFGAGESGVEVWTGKRGAGRAGWRFFCI